MTAAIQVIVVGAGPVGLCAALALARHGIDVLVLEREAAAASSLRACVFQPPTLDLLDELGLAVPLMRRGLVATTWQVRERDTHERAVFDLAVLADDTRHPFRVHVPQAVLCELAFAAAWPRVRVRFGAHAHGIVRQDDGMAVRWREGERQEQALARYVIAADGASGTLRRLAGLGWEELGDEQISVVAATEQRFEDRLPGLSPLSEVWTPTGRCVLTRLRAGWRVGLYPEAGDDPARPWRLDEPDRIEAKLQRLMPKLDRYELLEHCAYRVQPRVLAAYRSGRMLFAGSAAHAIGSTVGVDLNCGLHDAFALADTLAQVLAGADDALLDAYGSERRAVAVAAIQRHTAMHRPSADPVARRHELARLQALAADPAAARAYLQDDTMLAGLRRASSNASAPLTRSEQQAGSG